jgi:Flp pilus assembly protein TadD
MKDNIHHYILKSAWDEALKFLDAEEKMGANKDEIQYFKSVIHLKKNNYPEALVHINQAIDLSPYNSNYISERGVVLFHLGNKKEALENMDKALALDPQNPYRYSSRAFIKDSMGDVDGAISDYEMAVALDPEDSIAHNNLGLLQEKKGYIEKAKENFKKADQLSDVQPTIEVKNENAPFIIEDKNESAENSVNKKGLLDIAGSVFTQKNTFIEFIQFWKSKLFGKKIKD